MTSRREYVLARTSEEYERLRRQAGVWESDTAELLDTAGLASGARCLELGCGPGDTMRLMAERVGPTGQVIGVDVDAELGSQGLERLHAAGFQQCAFVPADLDDDRDPIPDVAGGFDLVFSRTVLQHLTDPVAALRRMWRWTAPGGALVVQDYDLRTMDAYPPLPVVTEAREMFFGLLRHDMGHQLPALFGDAGIGEPDCTRVTGRMERFDGEFSSVLTSAYRSVLPAAVHRGLTSEERGSAWFDEMAAAVATSGHYTGLWPLLISAYKRRRDGR